MLHACVYCEQMASVYSHQHAGFCLRCACKMVEVHGIDTSQLLRIGRSHEVDHRKPYCAALSLAPCVPPSVHSRYLGGPGDACRAARRSRRPDPVRGVWAGLSVISVRLVGRCGRAGCGRGARASVEASRPVAASGLGPPASRPLDADAADARTTVHTQAVHTVAATWYCVVGQIVQRPEGARCVRLHRFAIAAADQPAILPGRSVSAPKGRTADSNRRGDRREPQQLVNIVTRLYCSECHASECHADA